MVGPAPVGCGGDRPTAARGAGGPRGWATDRPRTAARRITRSSSSRANACGRAPPRSPDRRAASGAAVRARCLWTLHADGTLSADVASRSRSSNATTTGSRPRSTAPQSLPSGGAPTSSSDTSSERRHRIARRSRRCRWARPTTTQACCLPTRIPIESLSGEAVEGTGCATAAARSSRRTIRWRAPSG